MATKKAVLVAALGFAAALARPAAAQMDTPEWIEDVKWHATLGTGLGLETGPAAAPTSAAQQGDPFLLYFGGDVRKSWRWWYGLTYYAHADFYTGLVDYPMVPYKIDGWTGLSLGPSVFRIEVARARIRSDFGGIAGGYSTGTDVRIEASTLPTFSGDVSVDERNIVSYLVAPLQITIGHYNTEVQPGIGTYNFKPYTSGTAMIGERFIPTDWLQLYANMTFFKAYSNVEFRWITNLGVALGILENAVQFGLDLDYDHWKTPAGYTENVATFTLSARLRI